MVIEDSEVYCDKCYFEHRFCNDRSIRGHCRAEKRTDNKQVAFEEVQE